MPPSATKLIGLERSGHYFELLHSSQNLKTRPYSKRWSAKNNFRAEPISFVAPVLNNGAMNYIISIFLEIDILLELTYVLMFIELDCWFDVTLCLKTFLWELQFTLTHQANQNKDQWIIKNDGMAESALLFW
jgi:hypothetical protein